MIDLEKRRARQRRAYAKRTPARAAAQKKSWSAYYVRRRAWYDGLKDGPCVACGWDGPAYCKDWHHRDPATKLFTLGPNLGYKKERILAEIAKCDLLCAICHRVVEHGG